ncbi:MAG: hypothetical protein ACJ8AI_25505 [Rhodopila sp.]
MADQGNAEVPEIVGRQSGQDFGIDGILVECRLILAATQVAQPTSNIHQRSLRPGDAHDRLSCGEAAAVEVKNVIEVERFSVPGRNSRSAASAFPAAQVKDTTTKS